MSQATPEKPRKVTVPGLLRKKQRGQRITMLTAYDATFARLIDSCDIDVVLVGDSLGMVVQGHDNTLPVTLEDVVYHTRSVARGMQRAHLVADLPFMSYQESVEVGMRSSGRLIKEGRAEAVKLEGGARNAELVRRLTEAGIPVMGHIGLTPQSIHAMGGYRIQGKREEQARTLLEDALQLEQAGIYSLVLEGVPLEVAREITDRLTVPTVGIGAGPHCDGQVLVIYDLLGMDPDFCPRFLKKYETFGDRIRVAVDAYAREVRDGAFPGLEHSVSVEKGRTPSKAAVS